MKNIKVGDRVAFSRAESAISGHACAAWGIDFINSLEFNNRKFHKGTVTKIKTHAFLFFKLKKPIYLVDDYYIMTNLKPIKTVSFDVPIKCTNEDCITFCSSCAQF